MRFVRMIIAPEAAARRPVASERASEPINYLAQIRADRPRRRENCFLHLSRTLILCLSRAPLWRSVFGGERSAISGRSKVSPIDSNRLHRMH